jgi:glycosyltransferase involved in cell wall biosynthesis
VAVHLAIMDIYIMPSYREGFGITNIEAAAMALPVVSTRIPGCIDSVHDGVTGTLVPPRNSQALTYAIEQYLRDPDLRLRHGQAGRERVLRDFRPETIWVELFQEYQRVLTEKGLQVSSAG